MFFLVNYIPKIQAIDKSAAMIAELRRQGHDLFVANLVGLTEATRDDGVDFHHAVLDETRSGLRCSGICSAFAHPARCTPDS